MPRKLAPDLWLFGVAVVLLSVGVVMVYSASAIVAGDRFHDPYFFLRRQLCWALLGAAGLWVATRVDYRRLERFVLPLLIVSVALLVLVLSPPVGQGVNGTRRWIRLGLVSFQRAELAKLTLVVYLAAFLGRKRDSVADFRRGLLPPLAVAGTLGALVLARPALGNCLPLIALTFALLFLAGGGLGHLGLILAPAVPLIAIAIWAAPYRLRRITAFLDPWSDPRGSGFQIIQSWLAFGNGGVLGQGIGASKQKLFYLPEPHTDFIFAIIGEELGFLGAVAIVALFMVLVWRGHRIRSPTKRGGRATRTARGEDFRRPRAVTYRRRARGRLLVGRLAGEHRGAGGAPAPDPDDPPRGDARRDDAPQVRHRRRRHPRQDDDHIHDRRGAGRGALRPDDRRRRPRDQPRVQRAPRPGGLPRRGGGRVGRLVPEARADDRGRHHRRRRAPRPLRHPRGDPRGVRPVRQQGALLRLRGPLPRPAQHPDADSEDREAHHHVRPGVGRRPRRTPALPQWDDEPLRGLPAREPPRRVHASAPGTPQRAQRSGGHRRGPRARDPVRDGPAGPRGLCRRPAPVPDPRARGGRHGGRRLRPPPRRDPGDPGRSQGRVRLPDRDGLPAAPLHAHPPLAPGGSHGVQPAGRAHRDGHPFGRPTADPP